MFVRGLTLPQDGTEVSYGALATHPVQYMTYAAVNASLSEVRTAASLPEFVSHKLHFLRKTSTYKLPPH